MQTTPDKFMAGLPVPEVYRVGGSVRDELLGRHSKDSDYMVRGADTHELADAIRAAGCRPTTLKLRDGRVVGSRFTLPGYGLIEVALPRTERSTGPGHRDFEIITSPDLSIEDDAVRRDFTINALYLDVRTQEVLDPLGEGRADLNECVIRTTHPDSFRDDPLRTLRALRFLSKLPNFALSEDTYAQMVAHAEHVTGLTAGGYASGTVLQELSGVLMGREPGIALRIMRDTGVMAVLFPELAPMIGFEQRSAYHDKTTDEHTFDAMQAAANMQANHAPLRVRLALLFHDAGKPHTAWIGRDGRAHYYAPDDKEWARLCDAGMYSVALPKPEDHEVVGARIADATLRRLGASNSLRNDVTTLVRRHMLPLHQNVRPTKVRYWRAELGDEMLRDLIVHRLADVIGKGADPDDLMESAQVLQWVENERQRAQDSGAPCSAKDLEIDGHDLMDLGLTGPDIGRVQKALLHEVIAQPKLNNREWLLRRAEKLAREGR